MKPNTMWIEKELLHVPVETYQRQNRDPKLMKQMFENWDFVKAGVLTVVPNKNGKYDVIDGGTRTLVAQKLNGNVPKLQCMVVDDITVQQQALLFKELCENRRNIGALDKHRAAIIAGEPIAKEVEKIVADAGYCVKLGGQPYQFQAIQCLYRLVKSDASVANKAFDTCAEIACGEPIAHQVLVGIFELETRMMEQLRRSVFTDQHIHKLKLTTMDGIRTAITKMKHRMQSKSESAMICGMGVLEVLNHGCSSRKIRIVW